MNAAIELFVLFLLIGAVVGFAGGMFAIGGALIAIPVLTTAFGFSQHDAQGTAMVMSLASAATTMTVYARRGLLRPRDCILMTILSTATALGASLLVRHIPDGDLQRGFGVFLVLLAIIVWFGRFGETDTDKPLAPATQVGVGGLAGTLGGLFVVGGALVSVPLLAKIGGYSQQRAQATALMMLVPASAIALTTYASAGYVEWAPAIALALGAIALAPVGARVALTMQPHLLKRLFAVAQAAAGILLILGR